MDVTAPVLIVGSSGNVGSATIRALAAKAIPIRAGVRDPASSKAKELGEINGVAVVQADLSSPGPVLTAAFEGVGTVFIVTPSAENRAGLVATGVAAAKKANVRHLVVVSVPAVTASGELLFKRQFDEIEATVMNAGIPFTVLRLPMFYENQWANQGSIKSAGKIFGPGDPAKKLSLVSVADVGAAAANIISAPVSHVDKIYTLVSETLTFQSIAGAFTEKTGRAVEYVQVPYTTATDAMVEMGFPKWMVAGIMDLFKLADSDSPAAVPDTTDLTALLDRRPTSFEAWLAPISRAFVASEVG